MNDIILTYILYTIQNKLIIKFYMKIFYNITKTVIK